MAAQEIIPSNIAKASDIEALAALSEQIKALNETMLYFASAVLDKMPRLDTADRAAVAVETGSVNVGTVSAITNVNNFAGGNASYLPFNLGEAGLVRLYDNIKVT